MFIKTNKLLLSFIIFLSFLSIAGIQKLNNTIKHQNLIGNNYFSENTITINTSMIDKNFLFQLHEKYTNYSIHAEINKDHRFIKVIGQPEIPKLQNGRFINEDDNTDSICVIGADINKLVGEYIEFRSTKYKIIGKISTEETRLSDIVFLNAKDNDFMSFNEIKIDVYNQEGLYKTLTSKFNIENNGYIKFTNNNMLNLISTIIIIIFFISVLVISTYYVNSKTQEIKLKKIFGYSKFKIFFDLLTPYYLISVIAYLIVCLLTMEYISIFYLLMIFLIINISLYIPVAIIDNKLRRNI